MTNLINRIYDFAQGAITEQVGTNSNRQDVYGGAVDAQSVNNTYKATPSDDLQSIINTVSTDYNGGEVTLRPGDYTVDSTVTVPAGVRVTQNGSPSDSSTATARVKPSGDFPIFELQGSSELPCPQVHNIQLYTNNISGYSSPWIDITNVDGRFTNMQPFVRDCIFSGEPDPATANAGGSAIRVIDESGNGQSWTLVENVTIDGAEYAIETDGSAGYANGLVFKNVYIRNARVGVKQGPNSGANHYELYVQVPGDGSMEKLYEGSGTFHMDVLAFDELAFLGDRFIDIQGLSTNNNDARENHVRINTRRQSRLRDGIVANNPQVVRFNNECLRQHWPGSDQLPPWLSTSGTGTFSVGNDIYTIQSGGSAGDTFRLETCGGNIMGQRDSPWFSTFIKSNTVLPANDGILRMGWHSGNFEAFFIADPTDSIGTGITSNWIWRVVDDGGTVQTVEDTGVSLDGSRKAMSVCNNGATLFYGAIDGVVGSKTSSGETKFDANFKIEVESTSNTSREIVLDLLVQLSTLA